MRYILGVRIKYLTYFKKILFTYWITCEIAPANRMNKFEGFFKYFHGKNITKKNPWNSWCSGFNLPTFETSVSAILSNSTPTIRPSDIDKRRRTSFSFSVSSEIQTLLACILKCNPNYFIQKSNSRAVCLCTWLECGGRLWLWAVHLGALGPRHFLSVTKVQIFGANVG